MNARKRSAEAADLQSLISNLMPQSHSYYLRRFPKIQSTVSPAQGGGRGKQILLTFRLCTYRPDDVLPHGAQESFILVRHNIRDEVDGCIDGDVCGEGGKRLAEGPGWKRWWGAWQAPTIHSELERIWNGVK